MTQWEIALIAGMMIVTFGVRYPVLALVSRITLPSFIEESLQFIPPAVLTAIIMPAVLMPRGELDLGISNAYMIAGLAAAAIAWRGKNLLLTITLGMAIFWLWRFVFPV